MNSEICELNEEFEECESEQSEDLLNEIIEQADINKPIKQNEDNEDNEDNEEINESMNETTTLNTKFKYYPVMFGKWDKSNLTMSFEGFDKLTHELLNMHNRTLWGVKTGFGFLLQGFESMGIFEVYKASDGYFHLLFDVDEVKDIKGVEMALAYFDNLAKRFGNYAISGYTKDKKISEKYKITLCENAEKVFSAHIIFYETKASLDMIKTIFGKDEHKQYINNNILYQDDSIWESIIKGKSHLMRTCISNKLMKKDNAPVEKITYSNVINRKGEALPNSCSLITVRGDEREITLEDIKAVGIVPKKKTTETIKKVKVVKDEEQETKSLNDNELITMNYSQLAALLQNIYDPVNIDTTHELLKVVAGCLAHAGHVFTDKNELIDVIYNWYNDNGENPHAQDNAGGNYINTYYEQETKNNNWFYGLIKLINNEEVKQKYINKYNIINDFDVSEFIDEEAEEKNEEGNEEEEQKSKINIEYVPLDDVKRARTFEAKYKLLNKCIINMFHLNCYFSLLDSKEVEIIKYEEMKNKLVACDISKSEDKQNMINKLMLKTSSAKAIDFTSLYVGWKYQNIDKSENYDDNIKDFKECVLCNICNGDLTLFTYLMNRISYIAHNPGARSNVCVILQGLQGTGKNWYEDIICEIFDRYSNPNSELLKLTGKFNGSSIIGFMYHACNEALNADGMFTVKETMKKLIERPKVDVEKKGIDPIIVKNCLNIDITTNNVKPVLIDPEDRRYLVIRTNGENANDRVYWKPYQEEVINRKGFYSDVFNMIYNDFYNEEFLSLPIPDTPAKIALQRLCMNSIHKYLIKNLNNFEVGRTRTQIKEDFKNMSKEDKNNYSEARFVEEVINYCNVKVVHNQNKYYINNIIADKLAALDDNEEDNEEDNEDEENNEVFENWVKANKKTFENKFDYILSVDVKDVALRDYLIAHGYVYTTALANKLRKRGYKLVIK